MTAIKRLPRWLTIVIGLIALFGLLFYVGGGFVFADMIREDALTPQPPMPDYGVYVVAVDADTITITSEEERQDTTHPGVAGLAWGGGYGRLGGILSSEGLTVTRSFQLVSGTMPDTCSAPLAECDPVDIEDRPTYGKSVESRGHEHSNERRRIATLGRAARGDDTRPQGILDRFQRSSALHSSTISSAAR